MISAPPVVGSDRAHSRLLRTVFKTFGIKNLTRLDSDHMCPNKLRIGLRDHASALFFQTDSTYNTEDVTYDKQVTLACHDLFVLYSNAFSEASNFNLVEFNQGTQEKQRSPS